MSHKRHFQHYKRSRRHSLFHFLVSPSLLSSLLSPSSSSSCLPSLLFSSIPPCLCLCGERWGQLLRRSGKVLLSTARPTSPESDQTKGGGRSDVQRTPSPGAESERFDLTKIQLSSKLSPKIQKNLPRKFVSGWESSERRAPHPSQNERQFDRETSRFSAYTERGVAVADALRPIFYLLNPFFFFV